MGAVGAAVGGVVPLLLVLLIAVPPSAPTPALPTEAPPCGAVRTLSEPGRGHWRDSSELFCLCLLLPPLLLLILPLLLLLLQLLLPLVFPLVLLLDLLSSLSDGEEEMEIIEVAAASVVRYLLGRPFGKLKL